MPVCRTVGYCTAVYKRLLYAIHEGPGLAQSAAGLLVLSESNIHCLDSPIAFCVEQIVQTTRLYKELRPEAETEFLIKDPDKLKIDFKCKLGEGRYGTVWKGSQAVQVYFCVTFGIEVLFAYVKFPETRFPLRRSRFL